MSYSHQKGFSIVSIAFRLAVAGVLVLCAIRLVPTYLENHKIQTVLDRLQDNKQLKNADTDVQYYLMVQNVLAKSLRIEDIKVIKAQDAVIQKLPGGRHRIYLSYIVERPFFSNISLKIKFKPIVVVNH